MFITDKIFEAKDTAHGFFGRRGGVSAGIYDSLNCGMGTEDDRAAVIENRRRVTEKLRLPPDRLITMNQTHSAECVIVTQAPAHRVQADALATDEPELVLGVLTADCAPVLFRGTNGAGRPVIGAAHAGWKGALGGVLENVLREMNTLGAPSDSIDAVIGPAIGIASYEVSTDFMKVFTDRKAGYGCFFHPGAGEGVRQFDLPGFILWRLQQANVRRIFLSCPDTYANEKDYFSYRRATHRREPDYGRQISIISIRP
jgi:polyphenol oxidase